ncbi:(2Fe-2S)-binding protein [Nonomuraea solani]|uniref:(2Fe-2S)-binding protein n=1 Tax=Nonomuraea solani TaxID=1144553 RepID=UPI001F2FBC86|nr:(2Fe-2S)-binding protein [Nonomuraea solani]
MVPSLRGLSLVYVCVCRAVTENEVHDCIASGATSAKQIRDTTGAGGDCARCVRKICAILKRSEELTTA